MNKELQKIQDEAERLYPTINRFKYDADGFYVQCERQDKFIEGATFGVSLANEWVKVSERLPTNEDADERDYVAVWNADFEKEDTWHISGVGIYPEHTHWRRIIKPKD